MEMMIRRKVRSVNEMWPWVFLIGMKATLQSTRWRNQIFIPSDLIESTQCFFSHKKKAYWYLTIPSPSSDGTPLSNIIGNKKSKVF